MYFEKLMVYIKKNMFDKSYMYFYAEYVAIIKNDVIIKKKKKKQHTERDKRTKNFLIYH